MAAIIDHLNSIARDLDILNLEMRDISLSGTDLQTLDSITANLKDIVLVIESKTGQRKRPWTEQVWKDSEPHRLKAQSTIATVLSSRRLRNPAVFRRNIKLIYRGPAQSEFDSKDTTWRRGVIQTRCSRIQQLSADGIISWAIAYPPTTWGPCFMSNDIFDCLVEDIEPRDKKGWPEAVCETLTRLKNGEVQGCHGLEQLVHGKRAPFQRESIAANTWLDLTNSSGEDENSINHDMRSQAAQTAQAAQTTSRNPDNVNRGKTCRLHGQIFSDSL